MQSKIIIEPAKEARILLIGEIDRSEIITTSCSATQFHSRTNIAEALATSSDRFDIIAVSPQEIDEHFVSSLKMLRKAYPETKIFLLARMWQEPEIITLLRTSSNGAKLADDYYILPVTFISENTPADTTTVATETETKPAAEKTREAEIIQQQQQRIEILEKLVMEDELTGVKNRRFAREFLRQIIERAAKESLQVTLLIFDIDNFKQYNDLYGHQVGDNILRQAAILMQKCCRKQDVVARIGGDEFAVVFWNLPVGKTISIDSPSKAERRRRASEHPKEVINICERFRRELNRTDLPALGAEGKGVLTISGGLATFPRDGLTVDELFTQADKALLEAKRSGKNRVYLVGSEEKQQ